MKRATKIALLTNVLAGRISEKQLRETAPKPLVVRFVRRGGQVMEVTL